ncbi:MotA/TolQ/ExbB proton channel family protein [Spongiibacter sp. KMU-158]|uniref:MotA/TolQ/ExbB proton channel family protein n=1 Tax=Spongiibacter pelagi TaxID=2760804 RepID=A0A927C6H0_9GAMM|nr:MotA/TolQ/ExbB proton channel family protein [Spongiibacter pelagi]MBD2860275.1 MotA/TolQ/ExbB proton channel family protein [Spongiibacter pelagi]
MTYRYLIAGMLGLVLYVLTSVHAQAQSEAATSEPATTEKSSQTESSNQDVSLDAVLSAVKADLEKSKARLKARESEFTERRDTAKNRMNKAIAKMQALEAEGRRLEGNFESNRVELDDKARLLKEKLGALKELFGVFQQNASDLIGSFNGSPTSIQYPARDEWLEGFANRMKNASEVSSVDDIMGLWFEMQREITSSGDIVPLRAPVVTTDGKSRERDFVRVGTFSLITATPKPGYLYWSAAGQEVVELPRQPVGSYPADIDAYLSEGKGLNTLSVDPTGGTLMSLLIQKPTLTERVNQGGLVGYIILILGSIALLLAVYKFLEISSITSRVHAQQSDLNNLRPNNVLGQLLITYHENRHVDSETLEMRLHETVEKARLYVNRFTVFLKIIAAVSPLLGLLGTVVGMINTFQAITLYGTGDPQTMAGGISQALITTVLGLIVAVPAVLMHALVSGRGKGVMNILHQHTAAILGDQMQAQELVSSRAEPPQGSGPVPKSAPA